MNPWEEGNHNRREFLVRTGRGLLLGSLAAIGGILAARRVSQTCTNDNRCGPCTELGTCQLPQARTQRDQPRHE